MYAGFTDVLYWIVVYNRRLSIIKTSRLVNPMGINVFYPSLKVREKVISVNMKSGTMNVVFVAISLT